MKRQAQLFWQCFERIWQQPTAASLTILVIGIALALPLGFHLAVSQLQQLAQHWQGNSSLSLYLVADLPPERIQALIQRLDQQPELRFTRHINPEQAAQELRQSAGFAEALDLLDYNPLPHTLQFALADYLSSEQIKAWLQRLQALPEVDLAAADLEWVQRWQAIMGLFERAVYILAVLLALAVLLIIANTIRLEVQNKKEEIEIILLIGGTHSFVRRPFLYEGIWYGLLGGLVACILILVAVLFLSEPVQKLQNLYQTEFNFSGLSWLSALITLAISAALGGIGAIWAVRQYHD